VNRTLTLKSPTSQKPHPPHLQDPEQLGWTLPSSGQVLSLTVGDNLPASSLSPELNESENVKGKGGNQLKWKYLRYKFVL
jgi:hypothetical protein